jgi:hypothetical protein
MGLEYFTPSALSAAAEELVQFDMDSIRQVVASKHDRSPEIWLADPALYESNGRVRRDSPSSRLLAYSTHDRIVYATDGCNCCTRELNVAIETLTESELQTFAENNEFRLDLLKRLVRLTIRS